MSFLIYFLLATVGMALAPLAFAALSLRAMHVWRATLAYKLLWLPLLIVTCYAGAEGLSWLGHLSGRRFGGVGDPGTFSKIGSYLMWYALFLPSYVSIAGLLWLFPRRDQFDASAANKAAGAIAVLIVAVLLFVIVRVTAESLPPPEKGSQASSTRQNASLPLRVHTRGAAPGVLFGLVGLAWIVRVRGREWYYWLWVPSVACTLFFANRFADQMHKLQRAHYSWVVDNNYMVLWAMAVPMCVWLVGLVVWVPRTESTETRRAWRIAGIVAALISTWVLIL